MRRNAEAERGRRRRDAPLLAGRRAHPKPPHVTLRNNSAPTLTNTSITTMADGDDAPEVCLTKVESARALVG